MDRPADTLRIDLPELPCRIGTGPGENEAPQPVRVSVVLEVGFDAVMRSGEIDDTVDYAPVHRDLVDAICGPQWTLIEGLAGELMARALRPAGVRAATVRLTKVRPPLGPQTGPVTLEFRRERG